MSDLQMLPTIQALILTYSLPVLGGALLGLFFYGGLWWSVRRTLHSRRPGLLTLVSFWVRTTVTVLGFYLLMNGQAGRLIAAMVGFVLVRMLLTRHLRPELPPVGKEGVHANHTG